jgi:hypothetical protein
MVGGLFNGGLTSFGFWAFPHSYSNMGFHAHNWCVISSSFGGRSRLNAMSLVLVVAFCFYNMTSLSLEALSGF